MIIDCVVCDWRKTWRKKEQKTQVVLLFVVVFVCVFVLIDDSLFLWLMLFVDCWWIWQTDRDEQVLCCVLMVFFVSLFFHFVEWIDEFCGRWKKRRKGKARKWLIATKDVFCWLLLNWLIDFFFYIDWIERIFWLFLIYE